MKKKHTHYWYITDKYGDGCTSTWVYTCKCGKYKEVEFYSMKKRCALRDIKKAKRERRKK